MEPKPAQRRARKRNPALVPLSHDHHRALTEALRLKRVGEADREQVVRSFLEFWREHGRLHFVIEEELLLPALARHVPSDDPTIVEVLVQHVEIRRRVAEIEREDNADAPALETLGKLLDAHIRLEERVLFPRIEEALPPHELRDLGAQVAAAEARAPVR